jgi:hypothetical protein
VNGRCGDQKKEGGQTHVTSIDSVLKTRSAPRSSNGHARGAAAAAGYHALRLYAPLDVPWPDRIGIDAGVAAYAGVPSALTGARSGPAPAWRVTPKTPFCGRRPSGPE